MEIDYDIFISFKNSDKDGNLTRDRELAEKLYYFLKSKKLKIFFSETTLQELGTDSWREAIENALRVSKIFIALGTEEEYFYSYWIQRERTTFLTLKRDDRSKAIYSYIAPPLNTTSLPDDLKGFECFEDIKDNEFERLYSFISNRLFGNGKKEDKHIIYPNPYKGLQSFTYEDRSNYFGREKESKEIAKNVKKSRFFTLLGASGSGKSSLLFAGVLPLLKDEKIAILDFRPQDRPFRNLANIFIPTLYPDKLIQAQKKEELTNKLLNGEIKLDSLTELYLENQEIEKLYIMIDQFEELFTLTKDRRTQKVFFNQLLNLLESNLNITIIIALRIDFLSFTSYCEPFNQAMNQNPKIILGLMNQKNLKRAIELPAKKLGVTFETGLTKRLLEEISKEAGRLPLLEFVLDQFWQKMSNKIIAHKSLDDMGSISHAISYHADKIYQKHSQHQESIRRIFLKLVHVGSGTEDTRRVAKFKDFDKIDRDTLTLLATDRLIITTENTVEVVHEALIRKWKTLREWIEEHREYLEWEKRTRIDIASYQEHGKKEEDLLQASKLFRAKEYLETYEIEISIEFKEFIKESIKVQNRKDVINKVILGGVIFFLLIMIGVIGYFGFEADKMERVANKNEHKSVELNKKLVSVLDKIFDYGIKTSKKLKGNDLEIYKLIINKFNESENKEIKKLVEYSYYNIGLNHHNNKELDKAIYFYKKALKIDSKDTVVYYNMGNISVNKKKYNKSIIYYDKAIALDPNHTIFRSCNDIIFNKQKDNHSCYSGSCMTSFSSNAKIYEPYTCIGNAYAKYREYNNAIFFYKQSLKLSFKNNKTYLSLFRLQLTQKQSFDKKLEKKYRELFKNQKDKFIKYEMLKILQNISKNEKVNLEQWKQKYHDINIGIWNFDTLDEWIDEFDEGEVKEKLREAIVFFKGYQ